MTDWSAYIHYSCLKCNSICINRSEENCTILHLCRDCTNEFNRKAIIEHIEQTLARRQDSAAATSERAEGATPSHGGPTDRVSARDDRREDQSQRESPEPAGSPERGSAVQLSKGTVVHRSDD